MAESPTRHGSASGVRASDDAAGPRIEPFTRMDSEATLALSSTIHQFTVQLSHVDRGVYETLDLRVARHPSESEEFMCARVLAYCLEQQEGLAFSKGLADADQPALEVRDLTGTLKAWIEVGAPDAARLHRAGKAASRVAVYTHRDVERYWASLAGARIHRAETLELCGIAGAPLATLTQRLERRTMFDLSVSEDVMYMTLCGEVVEGAVARRTPESAS
jgi:uncharacterized protein YaeQ